MCIACGHLSILYPLYLPIKQPMTLTSWFHSLTSLLLDSVGLSIIDEGALVGFTLDSTFSKYFGKAWEYCLAFALGHKSNYLDMLRHACAMDFKCIFKWV